MHARSCFFVEKTIEYFQHKNPGIPMKSVEKQIAETVQAHEPGWTFTPRQFADLGDPRAIGVALTRLSRRGLIRRVARGFYQAPWQDPELGMLGASVNAIMVALKERDALRLQPSGAYAANLLGLSEQVPMKVVFLTDGAFRRIRVGKIQIILKRTTPRNMATAGTVSGLVIQALRHLGKAQVDEQVICALRQRLSHADKTVLLKELRYAPAWIAVIIRKIVTEE